MFRFKPGTIRGRLLLSFVLIALLPVLSGAIASVAVGIYNGRQQARERLESVAVSKETAVREWLDALQQQLVIVSATDCSNERIWVVVSLAQDAKYYAFYNRAVRNRLQGFVGQSPELEELFLIDANGQIALSTDVSQEGRTVAGQDFFRNGLEGPFAALPFAPRGAEAPLPDRDMATVTMPIAGAEQQVMGVIAGRARVDALDALLREGTGLGDSGKAYLLNTERQFLTGDLPLADPRLAGEALQNPAAAGILAALDGRASGSAIYKDLSGESVIGVYRWLPQLQAMLFVEQDESEAFGAIFTTLRINLIVALTGLVLAVGLSLQLMRGIANPLEDLAETATQIADGDLERHVPVEREDEIGQLAQAFNSMTAQLRELITGLEQRVAQRTYELQRLALRLETSAQVSREVTSILDIDALLAKVAELIGSAFGYYAVHIYLLDPAGDHLVFRASSNATPPQDQVLEADSSSLNGEVIRTNQAVLVNDVLSDPRFMPDKHYPGIRAEMVIPLRIGKRIIGTLDLISAETDAFRPEDVVVAQSLGDQISIAIENARLYERSQELAVLEERNRLAREVHDAMNQSLYSIVLFAGAAHKEAEKAGQDAIQRHLSRVEGMAQQALKEMRLMIYELRPQELGQKGLVGALQQRLEAVEGSAGMAVDLLADGEVELPPAMEEGLYRIVQEALNNALKHASATAVTVSLHDAAGWLEIEVRDDGVGFDPANLSHARGLGLVSMRERASALGATLDIDSAPGEGTCIRLRIPVDAEGALSPGEETL